MNFKVEYTIESKNGFIALKDVEFVALQRAQSNEAVRQFGEMLSRCR